MRATADTASNSLEDAARLLNGARRIAVLSHIDPDADAVGSIVGLTAGVRTLGKHVVPALSDTAPVYADFLPGTREIVGVLPDEPFDLYVFADAADIDRIGSLYTEDRGRFEGVPILNIDHHRTNPLFGSVNMVDGGASSTSEVIYRILTHLGAEIDGDTATALAFGIVGDTGSFRNGATTPGSLETMAQLLRCGANVQGIAFELFDRKRFTAARLWGEILSGIELFAQRRIVVAWLSQAMLRAYDATLDETEGIAAYLRGIEEADVAILMKETEEGDVKVSFRSRPDIDVSVLATSLGGGGHRQAAGCTVPGPRERAQQILLETYDRFYSR
jgi:phosphoesterase RecJ-like protein